ncbi:MAG: CpsB/CapC family capsule biosynthesis tyrosine phosphatase [Bacilli bacterium]|nr:CpsB/CapC family capsule biosynthesis tyrosine phosphatase [Bacilli bacterium]
MIDTHSHILFGIDDGSRTIEESINILKKASNNGIKDIILTPHYVPNSKYNCNNQDKHKLLNTLEEELKKNNIDINLYLGNEVYLDLDISNLLENDIYTINGSKYMLIELPMNRKPDILDDVLCDLFELNIIPVIAHPERYTAYYKDYAFFQNLIDNGCLLQGNIGSLYNNYGIKAKRMLKGLLKKRMISILGSDIHHDTSNIYEKNISKDLLKLIKDKSYVEDILVNNARSILSSKE